MGETGKINMGSKKYDEKYPLITVGALILNKNGQALFLKSNKWKGMYGIPAGKLRFGESIISALRREIKEETNLDVYDIKFLLNQEIIIPKEFFKKAHYVSINFVCKAKNENIKLNHEAESCKWMRPEEVLGHNFNEPTKELVQFYLSKKNRDKIIIKDLEIDCIIGIRRDERKEKQKILVSLEIFTDTKKAAKSSNISDAINYSSIISKIKNKASKMAINSKYLLLESLGEDIAKMVLEDNLANEVKVLIKKPKAIGKGRYAGVEVTRSKW